MILWFILRNIYLVFTSVSGFPGGSDGKESACNAGEEDPLEKGIAAHSSILAWRTLWRKEPGELQSTGSQRIGHD